MENIEEEIEYIISEMRECSKKPDTKPSSENIEARKESVTETVNDILREVREFADTDSQTIGRDVLRRQIQNFADRFKAAYKREIDTLTADRDNWRCQALAEDERANVAETVTYCNQSKLIEALKMCVKMLDICLLYSPDGYPSQGDDIQRVIKKGESALSEPQRNCDRFNNADELVAYYGDEAMKEAWRELREKIKNGKYEFAIELVLMIDWLFAEAKGEADEQM